MKENKLTDLDKILKDKLQDEGMLNERWNTPSDDLFFAAMDSIDEEREIKKIGIYWWSLGGVALLLLLILGWRIISNHVDRDVEIATIATVFEEAESMVDEGEFGSVRSSNTKAAEVLESQDIGNSRAKLIVQNEIRNETKAVKKILLTQAINSNNAMLNDNSEQEPKGLFSDRANGLEIMPQIVVEGQWSSNSVSAINNKILAVDDLLIEKENIAMLKYPELEAVDMHVAAVNAVLPNVGRDREITIYGLAGVNFSALRMEPATSTGYSLKEYNSRYGGFHAGIGVNHSISSKWGINYQVNYTILNNTSVHTEFQTYDTSNEFVDEYGTELYHTTAIITSPTTEFDCELDLKFAEELANNELMEQITTIDQSYTIIGLSVSPQYDIIANKKIGISAMAGLELNYIQAFRQDMELKMMHHNEIMVRETMEDTDVAKLNRIYSGASIGLNVRYNWTDRLSTSLQAGGMTSLNSIKQNADGVNTYISDIRLSLRTAYSF